MADDELVSAPQLLDTPKRVNLQSQSTNLRAALKDFERTFAANNGGHKPSKDDIKADADVAAQYKQYNRVRDVLSGKLEYSVFAASPKSPSRKRGHERNDSGVSCTPKKRHSESTQRKHFHPSRIDPYDNGHSVSPKPILLHAIQPTPQRDGRVLGLFDLMSNSAQSSKGTPSSRKRKLESLNEDSPLKVQGSIAVQTPSRKQARLNADLLDYLAGTPETGRRKHSRTPVSEGRKFMLSQFFATPSAERYSDVNVEGSKQPTPIRNQVLGATPDNKSLSQQKGLDTTPAYLRRSTSFKDRLLSASKVATINNSGFTSPPPIRTGPPTLRHFRSAPKLLSAMMKSVVEEQEPDEQCDDLEDDLEALREIENSHVNVSVEDSQIFGAEQKAEDQVPAAPVRVWKKKGQKRTTRRAIMRPTQGRLPRAQEPKFVAAEDADGVLQVDETQLGVNTDELRQRHDLSDVSDYENHDPDSDQYDEHLQGKKPTKKKSRPKSKDQGGEEKKKKKAGTINPNAVSHMNFRSLKIKNKNSKAKGRSGGRFGSRR